MIPSIIPLSSLPCALLLQASPTKDRLILPERHREAIAWLIPRADWPAPGSVTTITFKPSSDPDRVLQQIIETIRKEAKRDSPILFPTTETAL